MFARVRSCLLAQAFEHTCKGRGFSLPLHLSLLEWRHNDVFVCRPLRDAELKEVSFAVHARRLNTFVPAAAGAVPRCRHVTDRPRSLLRDLRSVWVPTFASTSPPTSSITGLVEAFLASLQVGSLDAAVALGVTTRLRV